MKKLPRKIKIMAKLTPKPIHNIFPGHEPDFFPLNSVKDIPAPIPNITKNNAIEPKLESIFIVSRIKTSFPDFLPKTVKKIQPISKMIKTAIVAIFIICS